MFCKPPLQSAVNVSFDRNRRRAITKRQRVGALNLLVQVCLVRITQSCDDFETASDWRLWSNYAAYNVLRRFRQLLGSCKSIGSKADHECIAGGASGRLTCLKIASIVLRRMWVLLVSRRASFQCRRRRRRNRVPIAIQINDIYQAAMKRSIEEHEIDKLFNPDPDDFQI